MVKFILTIAFLFPAILMVGQVAGTLDAFQQHFSDFRRQEFQEKVYLNTDKSYYVGGEYIWFSIYRTDAATHLPGVYSRFVYVELYNEREVLIDRLKVMERDGFFHGSLLLDRYLPTGRYSLRAYTYWMQNFDEALYFHKEVTIGNPLTYGVKPEIRWGKLKNGQDYAEIRIRDAEGNIFPGEFLDCRLYHDKEQVRKDVERINKEGWARYPLRRKDGVTSLRVQFLNKKPFEYQAMFNVPSLEHQEDVDIQFFPEGGNLIAGFSSRVGFKAVGKDGYGVDIYGSIFRDDGKTVGSFGTSHLGMGRFSLLPEFGKSYYAVVQLPYGGEKRVDLPLVKEEGIMLRAEKQDSVICYTCLGSQGFKTEEDLFLLVHSRGVLLSALPVEPGWNGSLALAGTPSGIVHGVIIDRTGRIYSERLSFVYPQEKETVHIQTNRSNYGYRDSVFLQLTLLGNDSLRCSVAITDSLLAPTEKWGMNIANYFLLTSDLKGHVESPGWYFDSSLPRLHRERMLDILLAIQGWTRFDVGRVCRDERDSLPFFLELSQGFSGRIKNFWGKTAKNSILYAIVPRINFLRKIETDKQGRFSLNVFFPDSTTFVFQALSARNSKWVELYMDKDSLRPPLTPLFSPERIVRMDSIGESEILKQGNPEQIKTLGYYYEQNRKIYLLEEARIIKKKIKNTYLGEVENIAEQILEARDIRDENITSLEQWLMSLPQVNVLQEKGERIITYGNTLSKRALIHIFINDWEISKFFSQSEILNLLNEAGMKQVERMGYITDVLGSEKSLTLFVYTKPGYSLYPAANRLDFIQFTPLGYHEPVEFYQPRYEVEEERRLPEPDERPTLYWNPTVRLCPGKSEVLKFYTSDREGPFRIVLEGITDKGEVIRATKSFGH